MVVYVWVVNVYMRSIRNAHGGGGVSKHISSGLDVNIYFELSNNRPGVSYWGGLKEVRPVDTGGGAGGQCPPNNLPNLFLEML